MSMVLNLAKPCAKETEIDLRDAGFGRYLTRADVGPRWKDAHHAKPESTGRVAG